MTCKGPNQPLEIWNTTASTLRTHTVFFTLQGAKIWISTNSSNTANAIAIALAGEGKDVTAKTIADESTLPVCESFTRPSSFAAGLSLEELGPCEHYAICIRRAIPTAHSA
ncbi:MAG: hypothetical protein GKS07_08450 [Nitrosopumilus sp.]|nr:MAG: hypothetical protein GKS07_08450 [Nitrosopumilus sp.]